MLRRLAGRCLMGAGALMLALTAVTSAFAQGMFYAEETKDGRVYVFNNKGNWERFKASGETGTGLTRLSVGPNGETVYADSETALELYFFKYGIKEVVERPKAPVQRIEWRDGKTRITAGDNFYMEMSNRIQVRFTHEMPDDSITLPGTAARGRQQGQLPHPPREVQARGLVLQARARVRDRSSTGPTSPARPPARMLEDAEHRLGRHQGQEDVPRPLRPVQGALRPPAAHLLGRAAVRRPRRSSTSATTPARETGLALWGTLGTNKLDWRVMVSNGNGRSQTLNDNDEVPLHGAPHVAAERRHAHEPVERPARC